MLHFDRALVPGTWGFALGDVDAEKVRVTAYDAAGKQLPTSALGFQSAFTYCQGTPLPSACAGSPQTDAPSWDPASSYLVGNVTDTNGAAGWFRPTAQVATLELYSVVQTGIPAYQLAGRPGPAAGHPRAPDHAAGPRAARDADRHPGLQRHVQEHRRDQRRRARQDRLARRLHRDLHPESQLTGTDSFTLRIEKADGEVLVRSFDVKVAKTLPVTGAPEGLSREAAAAVALIAWARCWPRRRARPVKHATPARHKAVPQHRRSAGDTMDP